NADKTALTWDVIKGENTDPDSVAFDLTLPISGANGTTITWSSSGSAISETGVATRPDSGSGDAIITLEAVISKGAYSENVVFSLTVILAREHDITQE
ncbi:MAG: hypothetical protein LBT59_26400, partial [Clostridiales bacterium]|nr:hypothetical protein [Clostridiales bacterium]